MRLLGAAYLIKSPFWEPIRRADFGSWESSCDRSHLIYRQASLARAKGTGPLLVLEYAFLIFQTFRTILQTCFAFTLSFRVHPVFMFGLGKCLVIFSDLTRVAYFSVLPLEDAY